MARTLVLQRRQPLTIRIVRGLPGAAGGGGGGGEVTKAELEAEEHAREAADNLKLAKAGNLSELANAATSRTNLGLGTAATQASTAFDAAGAATAAQSAAETASKAYTDTAKAGLKAEIKTETEAREAADTAEKTARESADTTEKNARETADTNERTRAEAKEAEAVKLTGNQTVAGVKTFSSPVGVPAPVAAGDATNKEYVDGLVQGASNKESAALATKEALPANSATTTKLTATANGALSVDGTVVTVGMRVLVKNEAAEANNGIYVVTAAGGASEKYVLTRSADMEKGTQVPGAYVFVESGATNESCGFVVVGKGPFTLGTTAIKWTQFSGLGEVTAGTGLTKSGNTISVTANTYEAFGTALKKTENLADLPNAGTARTNLGLGSSATHPASDFATPTEVSTEKTARESADSTEKSARETADNERLRKAENLKDVSAVGTSRANLHIPMLGAAACVATTEAASLEGLKTIDGYTLVENDVVLLTAQANKKQNGPWVAKSGAWERPQDFAESFEVNKARVIPIINGTEYKLTFWLLASTVPVKVGTDNQTWENMTPRKTIREGKAWVWRRGEEVKEETVDGQEFSPGKNETVKLCRVSAKVAEGKVEYKIQKKNGAGAAEDIPGFGTTATPLKIESTTAKVEEPTAQTMNAGDELLLVLIKTTGAKGLVVRPFEEHI